MLYTDVDNALEKIYISYKRLEDRANTRCGGNCKGINDEENLKKCIDIYYQIFILRNQMRELLNSSDEGHDYRISTIYNYHNNCQQKLRNVKSKKKKKKLSPNAKIFSPKTLNPDAKIFKLGFSIHKRKSRRKSRK